VSQRILSLAFSPTNTSQLLSCGDASGAIHLWDVTANSVAASGTSATTTAPAPSPRAFTGHSGRVRSVSYKAQQPHVFASGSDDGSIRVWDIKSPSGAAYSAELGSNVCGVAFSPWDENVLACGTAAHSVSVFDIRNCKAPLSQVQGMLCLPWFFQSLAV
jgi:E3 ubiquitin-protein ligase RFWD2